MNLWFVKCNQGQRKSDNSDLMWYFDPVFNGLITISDCALTVSLEDDEIYGLKMDQTNSWS